MKQPRDLMMEGTLGEDAAVHRVRPELFSAEPEKLLEVQTVDYGPALATGDPLLYDGPPGSPRVMGAVFIEGMGSGLQNFGP